MTEDYYKILGVNKKASGAEIKSAYRKLAKKYHPDRNRGDKNAEEMFKKISEAYAVLSDPEKKKKYDMFGSEKFHQRFSQEDIFRGADFSSIFREFGFDFGDIFGGGFGAPFGARPPVNLDATSRIEISLEESVRGGERRISFKTPAGVETLNVKIPAGIPDGGKLRLAGKGNAQGGRRGDLYIEVKIAPHPRIRRDGNDLFIRQDIPVSSALLGGVVEVETFEGPRRVKIPSGSGPGRKIRIKGEGVRPLKGGKKGDLYIETGLRIPSTLSDKQKELLKKLRDTGL
jgi:curved DNA-binding protein